MPAELAQTILDAVRAADRPLAQRDIVALLDDSDYRLFTRVGMALTHLARTGALRRQKARLDGNGREVFVYTPGTIITPGYTWEDEIGTIVVMAIADGYAMCQRPGCIPFVQAVTEITE